MKVAIEGCTHGELERIYGTLSEIERRQNITIDLLICCGDFQSTRNLSDLHCMAVPDKYKLMCSFYKYYSGELVAPVLTLFIGGNHEASNFLQELSYGGWVAPKIYYVGYAGVVKVNGLRIGGLSGIYKGNDYLKGHFERPPYNANTIRSVYHVRNVDVFRLKQLKNNPPDIMLSHDWPRGITKFGNEEQLIRHKPFLRSDIEQDQLGSRPAQELLEILKPQYWFSGHLHTKFAALVPHADGSKTKFLALDKCLPNKRFLQILDLGPEDVPQGPPLLEYDADWLAILRSTNHLLAVDDRIHHMPGQGYTGRWKFVPDPDELKSVRRIFGNDFYISSESFDRSVTPYDPAVEHEGDLFRIPIPSEPVQNIQTQSFCAKLGIFDPVAMLLPDASNQDNSIDYINPLEADLTIGPGNTTCVSFVCDDESSKVEPVDESLSEDIFVIDTTPSSSTSAVECSTDPPQKKVLKRRNVAIYSNPTYSC